MKAEMMTALGMSIRNAKACIDRDSALNLTQARAALRDAVAQHDALGSVRDALNLLREWSQASASPTVHDLNRRSLAALRSLTSQGRHHETSEPGTGEGPPSPHPDSGR